MRTTIYANDFFILALYLHTVRYKLHLKIKMIFSLKYLVLLLSVYSIACTAQSIKSPDSSYINELRLSYLDANKEFISELKAAEISRKEFRFYESNYERIFSAIHEQIREGLIVELPIISQRVESILNEIKYNNPEVPKKIQVWLVRENIPNAYTVCDGIIFVTLGLFKYLESEDQVASILCHEIGHNILNHSAQALQYGYNSRINSAADINEVKGVEVRRSELALNMLKKIIYRKSSTSREYEKQADSLGYELFKRTKYNPTAQIKSLQIIDNHDSVIHRDLPVDVYKTFFDLPNQKYKADWLAAEDFSSYNYDAYTSKFDEDSLSSHPEMTMRIERLKLLFPELNDTGKIESVTNTYKKVRQASADEHFTNLYINEQHGEAVYQLLVLLSEDNNNVTYKKWLGENFQVLYEGRKNYRLNKYIDRVSPKDQSKSYIRFLNFIWNLRLEELKNIADYYKSYN